MIIINLDLLDLRIGHHFLINKIELMQWIMALVLALRK